MRRGETLATRSLVEPDTPETPTHFSSPHKREGQVALAPGVTAELVKVGCKAHDTETSRRMQVLSEVMEVQEVSHPFSWESLAASFVVETAGGMGSLSGQRTSNRSGRKPLRPGLKLS